MARTNLKKVKSAIEQAAAAAIARLAAEREIDSAHIERHAEASLAQLERLDAVEANLLDYIEQCRTMQMTAFDGLKSGIINTIAEMRTDEQVRLASLRGHADDLNATEPDEIEKPANVKRLRAHG
jgi:hypothetical protein